MDHEGKERVSCGAGRTCGWGERGSLWICILPSGLPFQAAAGKMGKVLSQYRDLPMPIIILPQCLWKNTTHSGGREGVCAVFSAPAWKLITLGPPAQEGGGRPLTCARRQRSSASKPRGGHTQPPPWPQGEGRVTKMGPYRRRSSVRV